MAPSARSQQSGLVKGIANYHYQQTPDKTPLRPLAALLRTRWVKDVQKQILTHEDTFYELIINGYYTMKNASSRWTPPDGNRYDSVHAPTS